MATQPPVKIADFLNSDELRITTRNAAQIEGAVADGVASTANPVIVGGVDGGGLAQQFSTDASGVLNVNVTGSGSTGTAVFTNVSSASLAAGASEDLDTADITPANGSPLDQVCVGGEQPFSFTISTVVDGTATVVAGPFFSNDGSEFCWDVPNDALTLTGGNAGLDAWRISVTNNDNNKAAVYTAKISHRDL